MLPYQNTGDLNVKTGMNTLHAVEMVVVILGTAWWFVVLAMFGEVFGLLKECFRFDGGAGRGGMMFEEDGRQRSVFGAVKALFLSLLPFRHRNSTSNTVQRQATKSQGQYDIILIYGLYFAFLITLMAIGGHASQMNKKLSTTYLESFGPQVGTNFTYSENGVITGSEYWGNETSWSDCFTVRAPGSRSGFWREWLQSNGGSGKIARIVAGL